MVTSFAGTPFPCVLRLTVLLALGVNRVGLETRCAVPCCDKTETPGTEVGRVCAGVKGSADGLSSGVPGLDPPDIPTRADSKSSIISLLSSLQFSRVMTSWGSIPMFPSLQMT